MGYYFGDAVQARKADDHTASNHNRAARKIGAESTGNKRYIGLAGQFDDPGGLSCIARENNDAGLALCQGSIVRIQFGLHTGNRYLGIADNLPEIMNELIGYHGF